MATQRKIANISIRSLAPFILTTATLLCASATHAGANHTFTTELQEVRTGTVDGREYLTIHINSPVGPANCQSKVLRIDTGSHGEPWKQQKMESVALQAMLTSEPVVITVPLTSNECIDGKPTLTHINLATELH